MLRGPTPVPKKKTRARLPPRYAPLKDLKPIYLHGDPGCGKSYLMKLFYDALEIEEKKFMHYNEFMLEIHKEEHRMNTELKNMQQDTIGVVGQSFCKDIHVFCIDEFQVLDIADAMILKRLFESFIEHRMIIFVTTNRPIDDLYLNGLQRYLFMPFIDMMN